ncbi:MAG: response regulator [Gammaproteobacteria bacterium]|nr:response regulator [Gammaproteobacteria bacterium]
MTNKPKILVVDDDANLRKTLSDILRVKGYSVAVAGTGAEGIAEATREFVSVALIDLKLPDMSGIEVMGHIKLATPLTEAIILTGHAALDTAIEATNKGAYSYLLKPYEIDVLLQEIRHAVDRQQGQQEILRMASFPLLDPNPLIELDSAGVVTYLNPAAEKQFPELASQGMKHFVLEGLYDTFAAFWNGALQEVVREVVDGTAAYELRVYFVPESNLVRVAVLNITERNERAAKIEKLNAQLLALRDINENLLVVGSEEMHFQFVCKSLKKLEDVVIVWGVSKEARIFPIAWAGTGDVDPHAVGANWATMSDGFVGSAIRERVPVVIQDASADESLASWQDAVQQWRVKTAVTVPVYSSNEIIAALSIFSCHEDSLDSEFVEFLSEVASNIAIGIHTMRMDKKLHATLASLRKSLDGTVEAVARMLELRDPYTAGHQRRVSQLASAIGKEMELPERQIEGLRVIGYLHDIGKIAVPAEILSKPTALNKIEMALIREHSRSGYDILKDLEFPWPVAQAVLQHHERLDGSGYPEGLQEHDIILEAKIMMVADVVEAMATHRPYRPSRGLDAAINEITVNKGKLYDPDVVTACVRLFVERGFHLDDSH